MTKKTKILFAFSIIINILLSGGLLYCYLLIKGKETASRYKFTNPLSENFVDEENQGDSYVLHYMDLKPAIEKEVKNLNLKDGKGVGFFLQDIHTGAWLGIDEREGFIPASLLKVPIMMTILKKVEMEEINLDDKIALVSSDLDSASGNLYKKGAGVKISVWNLIESMILSSDNTAKNALKRQLSDDELNTVFSHVGIPNPYLSNNNPAVTPRGFSRIFKSLYYSTFLKPDFSERALEIMTDTRMENLISAGVPPEIQVSHKYGERPDGISDCGIIFHPQSPYMLCIMIKGIEISEAKNFITGTSKLSFDFISNHQ